MPNKDFNIFGPYERPKRQLQNQPRCKTFRPGKVDSLIYLNADWAQDLYSTLKETVSEMKDLKDAEGNTPLALENISKEIRGFARGLVQRMDAAVGRGTLEDAIDRGDIVQIAVTPKEQQFLLEIARIFDIPDAEDELGKLPVKGWY